MKSKFVLIGSGSQFTECFLQEFYKYEEFRGSTLTLVDRKPERLKQELDVVKKLNEFTGLDIIVNGHTDRREALKDANFIYVFAAVDHITNWKNEFKLAAKYGITLSLGETSSTAGLDVSMRHVPLLLDICKDIEEICPDAWLILESNPLADITAGVLRHTKVKCIGYCYGHELGQVALEQLLGMVGDISQLGTDGMARVATLPTETIDVTFAGLNHFAWALDIRSKANAEDLYPLVFERIKNPLFIPDGYNLSARLCEIFGLFPSPLDNHIFEYLPFADKDVLDKYKVQIFPVEQYIGGGDASDWKKISDKVYDKESTKKFLSNRKNGYLNVKLARDLSSSEPTYFPAINIVNNGAIPNLDKDIIVEVPAIISVDNVAPLKMQALPDAVAYLCNTNGQITNLVADATAIGSKKLALQALLLDPLVPNMIVAEKLLDEMLEWNKKYDTRFN
jgi:alpha-galactosidase